MKLVAAAAGLALFSIAGAASAQQATLRAVNAFAEGSAFAKPFEAFVEKVNAEGKGVVQINYIGGPKAMPPFEVASALKNGVVDVANVTAAFYTNLLPEGDALKLATRSIAEQRQNGAYEFINELHNRKVNAWYLARVGEGVPFHLYLTKPIEKPDLSGMTIRVTPVYRAFFAALGANVVQTPPGEVYTALERGVVQGYGWPILGVFDLGWQDKTRFRVDPGFYTVDVEVLVNLDRWRALSEAQRAFLTKQALWLEAENAKMAAEAGVERERQAKAGIQTITLQGTDAEKWQRTATDAGWAAIRQVAPENADKLRALLTK
jgi:TRAP-type C4-dicarboxylate transport system substrate-binding protein